MKIDFIMKNKQRTETEILLFEIMGKTLGKDFCAFFMLKDFP